VRPQLSGYEAADAYAVMTRYASPAFRWLRSSTALVGLDRAVPQRSGWLVYLATEPRFDALREDARFRSLLAIIADA
jgi:hypothetical protein